MTCELSGRQNEILLRLAAGETPKEIAFADGLSLKTVQWHWTQVKAKAGIRSYVEAAHLALSRGLISNKFVPLLLALVLAFPLLATAQTVTLAWDASPDTNVVGYTVYWGPTSGSYTNSQSGSTNLTMTLTNLIAGATYFFAATAFNAESYESEYSNEIEWLCSSCVLRVEVFRVGNVFLQ